MLKFNYDLKSFMDKVMPQDASEVQKEEMRKAFIAGAKITAHNMRENNDFLDYMEEIDDMFELVCQWKIT